MQDVEESEYEFIASQYRSFAKISLKEREFLYASVCSGAADDPFLVSLLGSAPRSQRRPNIVLAAVHFLLLRGARSPLASYYPSVVAWRGEQSPPEGTVVDEVDRFSLDTQSLVGEQVKHANHFAVFRSFCEEYEEELRALVSTRATQTNEVGRCAGLLPALQIVGNDTTRPLSLVDLGSSAGLNLLFDHYAYDYGGAHLEGEMTSSVRVKCEVLDGNISNVTVPSISRRVGIDREPIDLCDEQQALWLLACQWPHDLERFDRLRAAIELAKELPDRVSLIAGELIEVLPDVALASHADTHLCVMNTWVGAYLSVEQQRSLRDTMTRISRDRQVSWLYAESPYEVPGFEVPPAPDGVNIKGSTALVLDNIERGRHAPRRLADMHPHGKWIHWWDR